MSAAAPNKILIVLHGAIGDVTRGLSLAVRIKRAWPTTTIVWAIEPKSRGVVEEHPAVDKVIVFDRPRGFPAFLRFVRELARERADVTLDLQRHFKSGVTSFLSRAPRRVGFHRQNAKEFNWLFSTETIEKVENFSAKIEHYQKFGDALGLPVAERLAFDVGASEELIAEMDRRISKQCQGGTVAKGGRVALILGSSWKSRFWPAAHYRDLIHTLYERFGYACLLVGGPSEEDIAAEILALVEEVPIANMVSQTTLAELPVLFSCVRMAIGSDSGPMHIAAATGIPVISLWGSTSPQRSAPYGNERFVLQSPVGCAPCYRRECPGLGTLCMASIPPEAVLAQVSVVNVSLGTKAAEVANTRVD